MVEASQPTPKLHRAGTRGDDEEHTGTGHGGPNVALAACARVDAGSVLLNISRSFDVFAIVSPITRTTESLCPQLALKDSRHLDTILSLKDMTTVGDEILNNCQAWIPVLCTREIF